MRQWITMMALQATPTAPRLLNSRWRRWWCAGACVRNTPPSHDDDARAPDTTWSARRNRDHATTSRDAAAFAMTQTSFRYVAIGRCLFSASRHRQLRLNLMTSLKCFAILCACMLRLWQWQRFGFYPDLIVNHIWYIILKTVDGTVITRVYALRFSD